MNQSDYFRLATTMVLGMEITDGKLLFFHWILEERKYKKIIIIEYNNRTVND